MHCSRPRIAAGHAAGKGSCMPVERVAQLGVSPHGVPSAAQRRTRSAPAQALNAVGYGVPGSGLNLDLVYNPGGVFLAPPQSKLEPAYKQVRSSRGGTQGHGRPSDRMLLATAKPTSKLAITCCWWRSRQRRAFWSPPSAGGQAGRRAARSAPRRPAACRSWQTTLGCSSTRCCALTTCPSSAGQTTWPRSELPAPRPAPPPSS